MLPLLRDTTSYWPFRYVFPSIVNRVFLKTKYYSKYRINNIVKLKKIIKTVFTYVVNTTGANKLTTMHM